MKGQASGSRAGAAALAIASLALAAFPHTAAAEDPPRPEITGVSCYSDCGSGGVARAGSTIKVRGRDMRAVTRVVFHGGSSTTDHVVVPVEARSSYHVFVEVPWKARSGPVSVRVTRRNASNRSQPVEIGPPPPPQRNDTLSPVPGPTEEGAPKLETATSGTRARYYQERRIAFSYRVTHEEPVDVRIKLVRGSDGATVASWDRPDTEPGKVHTLSWSGILGGRVAPQDRYAFRLSAVGSGGASTSSARDTNMTRDAFDWYGHIFPIRGDFYYGMTAGRFGAPRGGRSHQGQDVMSPCGTRLVAARGGRVKAKQYHSAAGHYLVIDSLRSDEDSVYMHLTSASPFAPGDRVYTGQTIGTVGQTGNAQGCHLHFELWRAPGWYSGGSPFDPLPSLQSWEAMG